MQKQWSVEFVRCINEWATGCWDSNEMTWKNTSEDESIIQWIKESVNQWSNEAMKQWVNEWVKYCSESMNQRLNESMNQKPMNQWSNKAMNQRLKRIEPMNQWINDDPMSQMNQWINEPMNQWISERTYSANQWVNESVSQWMNRNKWAQWSSESMIQSNRWFRSINQWIYHWSNDSTRQWIQWITCSESMHQWSQWISESMNEWMNAVKDGWMRELVFFDELLQWSSVNERLRWMAPDESDTDSLMQLRTSVLSCLPASSSVASAAHFFSWHAAVTVTIRFGNLHLQPRIAQSAAAITQELHGAQPVTMRSVQTSVGNPHSQERRSQIDQRFVARSRAIAFAPNGPTCDSALQWGLEHLIFFFTFLYFWWKTELLLQPGAAFSRLIFQKCSERLSSLTFEVQIELSLQSCALFAGNFSRSRETETLPRRPPEPGATLPEKTHGFVPESVFTSEFRRFRTFVMMMWLIWWCGWNDGGNANLLTANHDHRR